MVRNGAVRKNRAERYAEVRVFGTEVRRKRYGLSMTDWVL